MTNFLCLAVEKTSFRSQCPREEDYEDIEKMREESKADESKAAESQADDKDNEEEEEPPRTRHSRREALTEGSGGNVKA